MQADTDLVMCFCPPPQKKTVVFVNTLKLFQAILLNLKMSNHLRKYNLNLIVNAITLEILTLLFFMDNCQNLNRQFSD